MSEFCLVRKDDLTDIKCELPKGHPGPHAAYAWTEWADEDDADESGKL